MQDFSCIYNKVNSYVDSLNYPSQPEGLYEPIRYVLSLGGKRIRPVLMLMAYELFRDNSDQILPNAVAMEVYHNFTLLHDDLMDRADMRRGHETVHKRWNDNTAILSGDAMLIMAYKLFTSNLHLLPSSFDVLKTFHEATLGVCDGQQYDIDFETRGDVTADQYLEMIRLKTSLLLDCSLKIGAQLAGASVQDSDLLYDFGEKMGLAFQLQDDLLDVYGDPAVFGKNIGGDILCNKKTFMLITALNLAQGSQKAELLYWLSISQSSLTDSSTLAADKIRAVTAIFDSLGIRSICQQKIEDFFAQALASLERVGVGDSRKVHLRNFANRLLLRDK